MVAEFENCTSPSICFMSLPWLWLNTKSGYKTRKCSGQFGQIKPELLFNIHGSLLRTAWWSVIGSLRIKHWMPTWHSHWHSIHKAQSYCLVFLISTQDFEVWSCIETCRSRRSWVTTLFEIANSRRNGRDVQVCVIRKVTRHWNARHCTQEVPICSGDKVVGSCESLHRNGKS